MDDRGFRGDAGSKAKGGRSRRDRGFREPRERRPRPQTKAGVEQFPPGAQQGQMKILTKTTNDKGAETGKSIQIKPRDEKVDIVPPQLARSPVSSLQKTNSSVKSSGEHQTHGSQSLAAHSGRHQPHRGSSGVVSPGPSSAVLSGNDSITATGTGAKIQNDSLKCFKIVDEKLHWNDQALETLTDQSDFLVVGVLGCQGVGKSTILSLLANRMALNDKRFCIFTPQSRQTEEMSINETSGIDMSITNERVIFLDTQPILNASILDNVIRHERNIPSEVTSAENYAELQSLQITTFLFTVCHVVLVVQDWFCDLNVMRFMKTAEMLKPTSGAHTAAHEGSSNLPEEFDEYYPNIVFIYNKCSREDFEAHNVENMLLATDAIFQNSRLRTKTSASMLLEGTFPFSKHLEQYSDVNLFLLPIADNLIRKTGSEICFSGTSFHGHPNLDVLIQLLRSQIFSSPRHHLTHHQLTEKNWFHFAARSWEMTKKSALLSEYNRLLP
ncbi:protein SMG9-like [Dendronephthya gigantea]|uniref:protein SMG9-like n=1 Tax=Dendronephthya gigantea TaxID=151771 RepID=UPI00106B467A|nr:protein SMG9-like [Dendronephthya gigantea]